MLSKTERRCRQKQSRRTRDNVNPEAALDYFQVSVNIIEARNLKWSNSETGNSYVVVTLGKEKYRTSITKKMEDPSYREYLLFEWNTSLRELQRSSLWMAVMEPRRCAPPRLLGETNIDLGVIWAQPNHQVFHKWTQLHIPRNMASGAVGFLKVDISIMCRGDVKAMPLLVTPENMEPSCLPATSEEQTANYIISIYNGFDISPGIQEIGSGRHEKLPSTFVKVSFGNISAKTAVRSRSSYPVYSEQVSITDVFPNVYQTVRFEVCSAVPCLNELLSRVDLNLEHISHDGDNGFVPTFGPSLLHMYSNAITSGVDCPDDEGPFYQGALLVALKTVVPYLQLGAKITSMEPIAPLQMENLWGWEDITITCPIFEVSMLDNQYADNSCGVAITIGEITSDVSNNAEKRKLHYTGPTEITRTTKYNGYLNFAFAFPVLQLATRLPGFRFRVYRNNLVQKIAENLDNNLKDIESRLYNFDYSQPSELLDDLSKAADVAGEQILKFFDVINFCEPSSTSHGDRIHYSTELDQNQEALQKDELQKIYQQITDKIKHCSPLNLMKRIGKNRECYSISKKDVKMLLVESFAIAEKLKTLVFKSAEGWPDIVLWLLNEGRRFAYYKILTSDIIFSQIPEVCGKDCGRIQTVYPKPLKCKKHLNSGQNACDCTAGKVELMLWMGLHTDLHFQDSYIPEGFKIKTKEFDMCVKAAIMMVECRVFIYRAKIKLFDSVILPSSFVRVNVLNNVRETLVQEKTSMPVWDQVLTVTCMTRISQHRIAAEPPQVTLEVYGFNSLLMGKLELLGRTAIRPVPIPLLNADYAPTLKWYDLHKDHCFTGQIFMSALIKQIPETIVKSTNYTSYNVVNETDRDEVRFKPEKDLSLEEIPRSLKPKFESYKIDIYWWGLRDMTISKKPCVILEIDDLSIKSDIIPENKANCNFPNGRISQIFDGHIEKPYSPPLVIKLYDSSTFGRIIFLGTNAVKNPTKYLVDWLPKYEREASMMSCSFLSSSFTKANKTLYMKKSISSESTVKNGNSCDVRSKKKFWQRLFCNPSEEEYFLLPMLIKEEYKEEYLEQDWWTRFYASQKEFSEEISKCCGKIKIYKSELENQPEYGKFKDWCSTFKLYNGKKSYAAGANNELCGFLKAGIAIYRWPPPPNTVAVSSNGVELQNGIFQDFTSNIPSRYLVRVYIVKGVNLAINDYHGKCDLYPSITCGTKKYEESNTYVKNTINPVFGRCFELQCEFPEDYLLTVSINGIDKAAKDVLVGSTSIDLEDRVYSRHRGRVGLSSEYNVYGVAKWRDNEKPSEILSKLCARNHIPPPAYPDGNAVFVNGVEYRDNDTSNDTHISASERKENICLSLLHKWHTLPLCGYHLVPEHVESRKLYNQVNPGVEQGCVLMWVDIFSTGSGVYLPLPVNITPRKIEEYELRVIIWHMQGLCQDNEDSNKGLDLYVKAWIGNIHQAHYTDIHYNTMNGEACFNWRMIFNFQYQQSDKKLVLVEKGPFTEYEERLPPILVVQVIDSDAEIIDDFLADLTIDLNLVPRGWRHFQRETVPNMDNLKKINLFASRTIRSWWPLKSIDRNTGAIKFAGMIDMELSLLPKEKAIIMPVGLGRDPPFPLPEPKRRVIPEPIKRNFSESIFRKENEHYILGLFFIIAIAAVVYLKFPNDMFSYVME